MRKSLLVCFVLTVLSLLSASQVRADGVMDTFTFTELLGPSNTVSYQWQFPASPTPNSAVPTEGFEIDNVTVNEYVNGGFQSSSVDSMAFFSSLFGPILGSVEDITQGFAFIATQNGGQLYQGFGQENSPTFLTGSYSGIGGDANGNQFFATLNVVETPEPTSILILFVGILGLAGGLAVRKLQA